MSDSGPQAYYQTGFPIRDTSRELERIARSIRRVAVTGYYTVYRFARADSITDAALRDARTLARARERFSFDQSKGGTATIIDLRPNGLSLITNDHVIRLPDTVIVHFPAEATNHGRGARPVESLAILQTQRRFVVGFPDPEPFTVAARDSAADLALLDVRLPNADRMTGVYVLTTPMGDASRLAWGSFVYVIGFPRGQRMVTRGIVSDPGYRNDDAFLVDGLFNRGLSGGLVLAVRGDSGALEWVGIATSAAAESDDRLQPESRDVDEEGLLLPYEGRLYFERASRIQYGITYPVSMSVVREFLRRAGRLP
ncbi:MAG TPA: serine protease [Longimicrobiales bacterium]